MGFPEMTLAPAMVRRDSAWRSMRFRWRWRALVALMWLATLGGCAVVTTAPAPTLEPDASIALVPIANYTETPQAGQRAEAIVEGLLIAAGRQVIRYPAELRADSGFEPGDKRSADSALAWAKKTPAKYALVGAVDEWRYKVGIDGEPAVGAAFSLVELSSGKTLWSATGARSGWSREALAAVGQKLMQRLLRDIAPAP